MAVIFATVDEARLNETLCSHLLDVSTAWQWPMASRRIFQSAAGAICRPAGRASLYSVARGPPVPRRARKPKWRGTWMTNAARLHGQVVRSRSTTIATFERAFSSLANLPCATFLRATITLTRRDVFSFFLSFSLGNLLASRRKVTRKATMDQVIARWLARGPCASFFLRFLLQTIRVWSNSVLVYLWN